MRIIPFILFILSKNFHPYAKATRSGRVEVLFR